MTDELQDLDLFALLKFVMPERVVHEHKEGQLIIAFGEENIIVRYNDLLGEINLAHLTLPPDDFDAGAHITNLRTGIDSLALLYVFVGGKMEFTVRAERLRNVRNGIERGFALTVKPLQGPVGLRITEVTSLYKDK